MSERADLIAAKERLTKSAAISTMATSGRSRSYDGHQMQMVRLEDLRLLLAENSLSEREAESLARMKAALGEIARMPTREANGSKDNASIDVLQGGEAIRAARLALRQHEDGK